MKNIKSVKKWIGLIALSIMVLSTAPATGQDAVEASAGADIVSKYVWRGVTQSAGASIQPALGLSYKGFSLGAWGSVSIANPQPYEFDLSLGYSAGGFSIGITDYYWNGHADPEEVVDDEGNVIELLPTWENSYFDYYADNHLLEGTISYSFGEKFPLTLSWNTFFAGNFDKDLATNKQQFSTYIEAAYDFSLGGLDFTASIGAAPWDSYAWLKPANGKSGFQISSISLTGSKKLEITPTFSVPLFVQCVFSPATDASHLVVGFSF